MQGHSMIFHPRKFLLGAKATAVRSSLPGSLVEAVIAALHEVYMVVCRSYIHQTSNAFWLNRSNAGKRLDVDCNRLQQIPTSDRKENSRSLKTPRKPYARGGGGVCF